MQFYRSSDKDYFVFAQWSRLSPLKERTCRPIQNGKRVPPSNDVFRFSFTADKTEELLGRFEYFNLNIRNRSAEFGYTVNPKFRRQGIGIKMLTTAITHLFSSTSLNKLYCQTAAFNIASIKLVEKLNLHRDAVLREHHELDGELHDDYIYNLATRVAIISKISLAEYINNAEILFR